MSSVFVLPPSLERSIEAEDREMDALGAGARLLVGNVWRHRAQSEMTASVAFSMLLQDLSAAHAEPSVRSLAAQAVAQEATHAEACRRLAARYLRVDVAPPEPRPVEAARFGDCPESVNRTLRVVLFSCVNETIGSAMLSAALATALPGAARAVLRFLLADEIQHARIGYGHLASRAVDAEQRDHVRRAIPTLLRVSRAAWYAPDAGLPEKAPPGHGCLGREELGAVVEDAIANLVLPGLSEVLDPCEAS